jgi:hypothetical protein
MMPTTLFSSEQDHLIRADRRFAATAEGSAPIALDATGRATILRTDNHYDTTDQFVSTRATLIEPRERHPVVLDREQPLFTVSDGGILRRHRKSLAYVIFNKSARKRFCGLCTSYFFLIIKKIINVSFLFRATQNVTEENKTALTHADIANRQDQNTRIKTTQRLPSDVPSEEKDKASCYELGVQKEALSKLLKNQQLLMSMLNETIAGLEKRVANISTQFLTTKMELKMSQEKITNTEALNTQCQSENNFLKKQKSDLVVQWSKSNSSFTKKINEYALLVRNNTHNLAQINMNQTPFNY